MVNGVLGTRTPGSRMEGTVKWNEIGRHPTKKFVYVQKGL